MFGANLVIVAHIYNELSHGQAKFPGVLSQNGKNDLEGQGQWPPFSIPVQSIPECMFGANLVIVAQIYNELSHGQAKFPRILCQNGQNDLEGQGQSPPFAIPAESIPWCMFGTNLMILAHMYDELSCIQAKFPRILSQNGQMTFKIKVNDPYFQYQPRVSHDTCLVQIWWFQLKVYGQTDGQTDRRRQRQYLFGLKVQGVIKHL